MLHSYHVTVESHGITLFLCKIGMLRADASLTVNAPAVYNIGRAKECKLDRTTVLAQSLNFLPYHKAPFRSLLPPSLGSRVDSAI